MNIVKAAPVKLNRTVITDAFWSQKQQLITDVVIPYQEKILNDAIPGVEKSHALANFRIAAGIEKGEFYGMVFQDSDVAKWLEGAAYSLLVHPDKDLEKRMDEVIDTIAKAQQPDGYLNTYFTVKEPEHRYQNLLECHEFYCAGHMMEAAAAYYEATGKDVLLRVMERMADNIAATFGPGKQEGIPGHPEIEIGLLRMYEATKNEKYRDMAQYFIDTRGQDPDFFVKEAARRDWKHEFNMDPANTSYSQSHKPVREQDTAEGHSVRAVYLFTAMAELAGQTGDKALLAACERLWENIVNKRMYVTGGIGSTVKGEAFTIDYDLPNDTVYAETCASIGLVFFARKMLDITMDGKYADIMELELYNGIISGMQLDGQRFFYVNPLDINPGVSGVLFGHEHVLPQRPQWYTCACCPPNVTRLVSSLGGYVWNENDTTVFANLFMGGKSDLAHAEITCESEYPWNGKVSYTVSPKGDGAFTFAIRIPGWLKEYSLKVNGAEAKGTMEKGYCYIEREWKSGDIVELTFDMPVRRVYCSTAVRANQGLVAIKRGPVVYCFEGVDNGKELQALRIPRDTQFTCETVTDGKLSGAVILKGTGLRAVTSSDLYSEEPPKMEKVELTAVPYYTWGNRGLNQMRVWMIEG